MKNKFFGIICIIAIIAFVNLGCGSSSSSKSSPAPGPDDVVDSPTELSDWLDGKTGTVDDPLVVKYTGDLGDLSATGDWQDLLEVIENSGQYISLDLSDCTMTGIVFSPDNTVATGKGYIVSIILPDAATSIGDYAFYNMNTYSNDFISLKSVSAEFVTDVGYAAFALCTALESVSLPKATTIGDLAFGNCTALENISLPVATTIGGGAFGGCRALANISLPAAATIGESAFESCPALESISLPAATTIGNIAFYMCTVLESVDLPVAKTIGDNAFRDCTALTSVDLPVATTIGNSAFYMCTALESVDLPVAETIGSHAFERCAALESLNIPLIEEIGDNAFRFAGSVAFTITMGATPPSVGTQLFFGVGVVSKSVTVKVPSGATGYGSLPFNVSGADATENWANAFRGKGWDGTTYLSGTINTNITLNIEEEI